MFDYELVGAATSYMVIDLIDLIFDEVPEDRWPEHFFLSRFTLGSFHKPLRSQLHQDKEESGKKMHHHLDQSASTTQVTLMNRVLALLHTKLARISDSSIPHIRAFTCRWRHLSLSTSPLLLWYIGPMCLPFRSTLGGDTGWRLLPAGRPHCFAPFDLL